MNIVLIGFMGCGKSSVGKKIANKMNMNFIDLDKIIEKNENTSIQTIFDIKGEPYFRALEKKWLLSYNGENSIISLGGGTPCYENNIELINKIGISIYLEMNTYALTNRLYNSKQKRPLIEKYKNDKGILYQEIEKLLSFRKETYKKANIIFEATNMSANKIEYLIEMLNTIENN